QRRIGIGGAVTVLAANLDGIGDFAVDQAVAVTILREVAIGALHAFLGVDVHQVDRLAGIRAGLDELAFAFLAPFLGVVGRNQVTFGVEQVAFAVALEHRAEVPAVAVVVGELGVLELRIEVVDVAQEVEIGPLAARRRAFGVAVEHRAHFGGGRVFLLFGPHRRSVGLVVPHRVA